MKTEPKQSGVHSPQFAVITIILLLACLLTATATATERPTPDSGLRTLDSRLAVRAVIGEAAGEGPVGMLAVAAAIRNRGTLRGVYGVNNPIAQHPSSILHSRAQKAWAMSATNDITRGATHWENVKAFGTPTWARSMTVTTNIGRHTFYK